MVETVLIAPFFFLSMLFSLATLLVVVYSLYDVLLQRPDMDTGEKLIWTALIIIFPPIGSLVYFFVVWHLDERPFKDLLATQTEDRKLDELDKLHDLKERGALTEEEFQEEKRKILHDDEKRTADRETAAEPTDGHTDEPAEEASDTDQDTTADNTGSADQKQEDS